MASGARCVMLASAAVIVCFLVSIIGLVEGGANAKQLHDDILANYSPSVRPRQNYSQPVMVEVDFVLHQITNVDDVNQILYTQGYISAYWYDDYLTWDPDHYDGIEHVVFPPNEVWLPDIGIINSAGSFYESSYRQDFHVNLHYDGYISWTFGGGLATMCDLDLSYFPFDWQECSIEVENWAYHQEDVDLWNGTQEVVIADFRKNGIWDYTGSRVATEVFYHDVHSNTTFPKVIFTLFLKRKPLHYVMSLLVPCYLILAVALTLFWMPPEAGEKVSVGITVVLAYTVFQIVLNSSTPQTSDNTPVMGEYVLFVMSLSSVSTLTSIIVLYLHHKGANTRLPRTLHVFFFRYCATLLCMRSSVPDDRIQDEENSLTKSRLFNNSKKSILKNGRADESTPIENTKTDFGKEFPQSSSEVTEKLGNIEEHLKYLSGYVNEKEKEERITDEWKAMAAVVDRIFFWVALVITVIVISIFMVQRDSNPSGTLHF